MAVRGVDSSFESMGSADERRESETSLVARGVTEAPPGSLVGLLWNDETRKKIELLACANPALTAANLAAHFNVSLRVMNYFLDYYEEAREAVENGRARGDNMIAQKNFAMALKGDARAMDREMKKRKMIGTDILPPPPPTEGRDYSRLSADDLRELARLDALTRKQPN